MQSTPETEDIKLVGPESYPVTLRNMDNPPRQLYVRGRFIDNEDQKYLCVVGSRRPTSYGIDAVQKIISGLRGYPITIVSGLAFGIDITAHAVALKSDLHCVAFPGSTLEWDEIYPTEHLGLAKEIVERGGALISEWGDGYLTGKWSFPARNRLMAGLSHATLIIEAGHKSGSLMTAKYAEDYSRDVLAVPGPIDAPLSYGPHMLIQRGAGLVTSAEDVLEQLGFNIPRKNRSSNNSKKSSDDKLDQHQDEIIFPKHITEDPLSINILQMLKNENVSIDSLKEKISAPIVIINQKLSLLEIEGLVKIDGVMVRLIRN